MRMREIANKCGVSVATMYRKLAENGRTMDEYRDASGNISEEKFEELRQLIFIARDENLARRNRELLNEKRTREETEETRTQLAAVKAELSMARQTIANYEQQIETLNKQLEAVNRQRATAQQIASQAQQLQLQQMQLLSSGEGRKARGFFARIFGRATTGNGNAASGKEE